LPTVKLACNAGFCFGVDRALKMVNDLLDSGKKVRTLGPLIHNPQVVEQLEKRGAAIIETPGEAESGCVVVIRTHGVPRDVLASFEAAGADICDATCPFVKKIQQTVAENSAPDIPVLIAGDSNHPEVRGIMSCCRGPVFTFKTAEELEALLAAEPRLAQSGFIAVAQTTFGTAVWEACKQIIKSNCTNAVVFDTICNATGERQAQAEALSAECDMMIVIGGRESSNTAKLRAVCETHCETHLIETADELSAIDFSRCRAIGVTAGASTPPGTIKEVLETMSDIFDDKSGIADDAALPAAAGAADSTDNGVAAAPAAADSVDNTAAAASDTAESAAGAVTPAPDAGTVEPAQADGGAADEPESEDAEFKVALEESLKSLNSDQKVRGVVMGISATEIQVDIGRKHAGYVPFEEYSADPNANPAAELKVGDEMDLIILKTNDTEGTVVLSKRRCDAMKSWFDICDAENTDTVFEGVVTEIIKGGLLVLSDGVKVFVPASLATASRGDPLDDLLNKRVNFKIIEVNKQRKRAVGSIKATLSDSRKAAADAFWATAAVGDKIRGVVKSMTSYGAFVDIGGVDGMIHISELSWKRIKDPSEVLAVGDEVDVTIKGLDPEKRKISLGYKKAEDSPWEQLREQYPVGSVLEAEIVGMTTFGAFARVMPGIDGLIHISQIANRHIEKPQDELKIGQTVTVKVTGIDFDRKRVSLSIRALLDPLEGAEAPAEEAAPAVDETAEEAAQTAEPCEPVGNDPCVVPENTEEPSEPAEEAAQAAEPCEPVGNDPCVVPENTEEPSEPVEEAAPVVEEIAEEAAPAVEEPAEEAAQAAEPCEPVGNDPCVVPENTEEPSEPSEEAAPAVVEIAEEAVEDAQEDEAE